GGAIRMDVARRTVEIVVGVRGREPVARGAAPRARLAEVERSVHDGVGAGRYGPPRAPGAGAGDARDLVRADVPGAASRTHLAVDVVAEPRRRQQVDARVDRRRAGLEG